MLTLLRTIARLSRGERGQVLVVGVGVLAIGLGAIMISVDVGWWLRDKRDAQNDADAIAMAAAQELPDRTAAELRGEEWAVANGIDPSSELAPPDCADGVLQGSFCFIDENSDGEDDKVRAKVSRSSKSFIAEALGVGSPTLNPPAAAARLYGVASCILPWGIVADNSDPADFYGLDRTALYTFQDTNDNSPGNYGAVSIYGTGADVYKEVIRDTCYPVKNNACTLDVVVAEGETLDNCRAKTGRLGRTTSDALNDRFAGKPELSSACNAASYEDAADLVKTPNCDGRAVPLGIINAFPPRGSSADISIYGIAIFYIAGWQFPPHPITGYVWGYLLTAIPVTPAWQVQWDVSKNPFAPAGIFLVE